MNCHWMEAEEAQAETETALWAYGRPLTNMAPIKYLGRLLTATD